MLSKYKRTFSVTDEMILKRSGATMRREAEVIIQ